MKGKTNLRPRLYSCYSDTGFARQTSVSLVARDGRYTETHVGNGELPSCAPPEPAQQEVRARSPANPAVGVAPDPGALTAASWRAGQPRGPTHPALMGVDSCVRVRDGGEGPRSQHLPRDPQALRPAVEEEGGSKASASEHVLFPGGRHVEARGQEASSKKLLAVFQNILLVLNTGQEKQTM